MRTELLTADEYQKKLSELETLRVSVSLDEDPTASGLNNINVKIASLQASLERVSALVSEAIVNKCIAQQALSFRKNTYDMAIKRLLVNDVNIKALRSVELRTAAADIKSLPELDALQSSESSLSSADTFLKCASQVRWDLEMKNKNLFEQINVIRMMMRIDTALADTLRTM